MRIKFKTRDGCVRWWEHPEPLPRFFLVPLTSRISYVPAGDPGFLPERRYKYDATYRDEEGPYSLYVEM